MSNYCSFVELPKLILRYTGRLPNLPGAEPGNLTPEVVAGDATLLSLKVEAGEMGIVRISEPPTVPVAEEAPEFTSEVQNEIFLDVSERAINFAREQQRGPSQPEALAAAVANLLSANDPQSVALRVQRIVSQSSEDLVAEGADQKQAAGADHRKR